MEEALDLSFDRLLMMMMQMIDIVIDYYFSTYWQHLISAFYLDVSASDLCCDTLVSLVPKRRMSIASSTR